jgi:hypothetical protein
MVSCKFKYNSLHKDNDEWVKNEKPHNRIILCLHPTILGQVIRSDHIHNNVNVYEQDQEQGTQANPATAIFFAFVILDVLS